MSNARLEMFVFWELSWVLFCPFKLVEREVLLVLWIDVEHN